MNKSRQKILTRVAQAAVSTEGASKTKSVAGAPNPFVASMRWPQIQVMWGPDAPKVNYIFDLLNKAAFYSSGGTKQMLNAQDGLGGFAERQISDPGSEAKGNEPLKKIITLIQKCIAQLAVGNATAQLQDADMKTKLDSLLNEQALTSMPAVNPTGQLATKMPADTGNLKTAITNILKSFRVMQTQPVARR